MLTWLKNTLGLRCSDDELSTVQNGNLELGVHITLKSTQTFALCGSIGAPVLAYCQQGERDRGRLCESFTRGGLYGAAFGLAFGAVFSALYNKRFDEQQLYDKCYMLRFNTHQVLADRLTLYCTMLGAAAGAVAQMSPCCDARPAVCCGTVATGAVVGMDLGTLALILRPIDWNRIKAGLY